MGEEGGGGPTFFVLKKKERGEGYGRVVGVGEEGKGWRGEKERDRGERRKGTEGREGKGWRGESGKDVKKRLVCLGCLYLVALVSDGKKERRGGGESTVASRGLISLPSHHCWLVRE
jgi:hypothetical protein